MENKDCIGCRNIEQKSFPFVDGSGDNKPGNYIDTEGCGLVQNEKDYYLKIYFCPVCGKKLQNGK